MDQILISMSKSGALFKIGLIMTCAHSGIFAHNFDVPVPPALPIVPEEFRISLSQARLTALLKQPQISQAKRQITSSKNNLSATSSFLNPTVSFSGVNNTVASLNPANLNNYSLGFVIETSGRLHIRTLQAKAQLQGVVADSETVRQNVLQAVTASYIDLQVANRSLKTEEAAFTSIQQLTTLTEKQFMIGFAPETNFIRAKIALSQAEQNLLKAVSDVKIARSNLSLQMGFGPERPADVTDALDYSPLALTLPDLQSRAMLSRSEIQSSLAMQNGLKAAIKLQSSQYLPDLNVQTSARFDSLQMGVSVPLFDFGSIRGSVRKAKEDSKAQGFQTEQVRQSIRFEVETAWLQLDLAQHRISSFQKGILPEAESLFKKIEKGFGLGQSTILDFLDAQQTFLSSQNDYNGALGDYQKSINQLERAIGEPIKR